MKDCSFTKLLLRQFKNVLNQVVVFGKDPFLVNFSQQNPVLKESTCDGMIFNGSSSCLQQQIETQIDVIAANEFISVLVD